MTKFFNKWFRKVHRWLVWPFIILLILVLFTRDTDFHTVAQRIQAPLLIIMALTGGYMWLLPYIAKWQRNRRKTD